MTLPGFLLTTFGISLAGFTCVALLPGAQSPEALSGLPFWLVMVWGPTLAALLYGKRNGELGALLQRSCRLSPVPPLAWALAISPLLLLALLAPFATGEPMTISPGLLLLSVSFNLILGPLGEELGWRGVLQHRLNQRMHWLLAALLVGILWGLWHLPLWLVDSPQAQIRLPLFLAHCLLYAILIGAIYTISNGSLLPSILAHLSINLAANWALVGGYATANDWFETSLWHYLALAACATTMVHLHAGSAIQVRHPLPSR